jgi:hypothetical protein
MNEEGHPSPWAAAAAKRATEDDLPPSPDTAAPAQRPPTDGGFLKEHETLVSVGLGMLLGGGGILLLFALLLMLS